MTNLCTGKILSRVFHGFSHPPFTNLQIQQTRSTYILKRRWPPGLAKIGRNPKLKSRNFVYDLVQDTCWSKKGNVDVILTKYVEGLGDVGDKVSVQSNTAYSSLLLPGLAVYASPENLKKFEENVADKKFIPTFSSPTAAMTVNYLSRFLLGIVMNKETSWILEPWHIRVAFRKAGVIVPEYAIEMPKEKISGPNLDIEQKEFKIVVTVNKTEKVSVRCRIHHWSTKPGDRLPWVKDHWLQPSDPLFPDKEMLEVPDDLHKMFPMK